MRKAWPVMGTVVSLEIPGAKHKLFGDLAHLFEEIDARFSTYKKDSEVSQYALGALKPAQLSIELAGIIKQCKRFEKETAGYFSAQYSGRFDPSGYVKGWVIAQAGKLIEKNGHSTYCLGVGGDILAKSRNSKIWRIGISNPQNTKETVCALSLKDEAVATSGNYERGKHIYNPKTGKAADFWQSVTVISKDIIKADVWATAAFAMDDKAAAALVQQDLDFLLIDKSGHLFMSDGAKTLAGYS
jgi:thiamine biosynthesis lipoprotein